MFNKLIEYQDAHRFRIKIKILKAQDCETSSNSNNCITFGIININNLKNNNILDIL